MNADNPDHRDAPIRSALVFPKCLCGDPKCPDSLGSLADDEPEHERADDDRSFTPTMQRIRPGVERENRRWGWGR